MERCTILCQNKPTGVTLQKNRKINFPDFLPLLSPSIITMDAYHKNLKCGFKSNNSVTVSAKIAGCLTYSEALRGK